MSSTKVIRIKTLLTMALSPDHLVIIDESAQHIGHAHADGGHFKIEITSSAFIGKSLLERHRMVYQALQTMLAHDIHALSIIAKVK